jgi:hypothetical protein
MTFSELIPSRVYTEILEKLSPPDAGALNNWLLELMSDDKKRILVKQLVQESNLLEENFRDFLMSLLQIEPRSDEFFSRYESICKEHFIQGRSIGDLGNRYLGHVVYKEVLVRSIIRGNNNLGIKPEETVSQYIEDLISDNGSDYLGLTDCRMNSGEWRMFATFCNEDNNDPFSFMQTRDPQASPPHEGSPYEVILSLALGSSDPRIFNGAFTSLLLLSYESKDVEAHVPTVADAYGNKYFLPSGNNAICGWTDPNHTDFQKLHTLLRNSGHETYNTSSRPEVVHRPILMGSISTVTELKLPVLDEFET